MSKKMENLKEMVKDISVLIVVDISPNDELDERIMMNLKNKLRISMFIEKYQQENLRENIDYLHLLLWHEVNNIRQIIWRQISEHKSY